VDPPEHTHYWQLLNRMFGPARMKTFVPAMRERAGELLDGIIERGECDFVQDFAYRFGPYVFMHILGLPVEEVDQFLEMAARRTWGRISKTEEETRIAQEECDAYRASVVSMREAEPRDDLITELVQSDLE